MKRVSLILLALLLAFLSLSPALCEGQSTEIMKMLMRYAAVASSTMAAAFYLAQLANPAMDKSGFPADLLLQWMNRGYDESAPLPHRQHFCFQWRHLFERKS